MPAPAKPWDLRDSLVAATVMLVMAASPRATATLVGIAAGVAIGWLALRFPNELRQWRPATPTLAALLFAAFALTSVIWSADRGSTLVKVAYLTLIVAGGELVLRALDRLGPVHRTRLLDAVLIALLIAFAYAAFESASGQFIVRKLYTAFPRLYKNLEGHVTVIDGIVTGMSETNINRRVGLMTLLAWPTALMLAGIASATWRAAGLAMLAGLVVVMIGMSGHQSSQLAAAAGLATFLLASFWPVGARRLIATAWCVAVLAIVPMCAQAFSARLHEAPWLFLSARHRVAIWGHTASEVTKSPILGIGADATNGRFLETLKREPELKRSGGFELATTRHAHNGYLQIWYELGAIGAALFAIAGLAYLVSIGSLAPAVQPFATAQFATFAGIIATSYGMWQMWFQASIALSALALLSSMRLQAPAPVNNSLEPAPHAPAPRQAPGDLVT
jgi:O-antigen ligase